MRLDGCDQQVRIIGPPSVDLVIDDDLVLCLLQLHHLSELVWLARLPLANDFGRWLKQAEELAFTARVAAEDAGSGLFHHLPDQQRYFIELPARAVQRQLFQDSRRPLHSLGDLLGEALRLTHHPARCTQQLAIALLQLVLIDRAFGAASPARSPTAAASRSGCDRAAWFRPRQRSQ